MNLTLGILLGLFIGLGLGTDLFIELRSLVAPKQITTSEIFTGFGALIAIILLYWRSQSASRQAEAAIEQSRASARSIEELAWSNMLDRFSKAVDQIGEENTEPVRCAGIHIMKAVAHEFLEMRESVIEILQSYLIYYIPVPNHSGGVEELIRMTETIKEVPARDGDIKAAIEAILYIRNNFLPDRQIKFGGLDLRGVILNDMDLHKIEFFRSILLECDFRNSNLTECDLRKSWLWSARLQNSRLINVRLSGAHVRDLKFEGATGLLDEQLASIVRVNECPAGGTLSDD